MKEQLAPIEALRQRIIDEILNAMGLSPSRWAHRLIGSLFWPAIRHFCTLAAEFDQKVAQSSFVEAARWILPNFVKGVEQSGAQYIPREGPVLIAANHPGAYDVLVVTANIPRPDLKIVASNIPFFRELPATGRHLIFTHREVPQQRMTVVRKSIRHLSEGGALLIFPGGRVTPDPAILPDDHEILANWSPSLDILLRRVPQTQVVLSIIGGVLKPSWLRHPLVRLRRGRREQQLLAEFLQVIQQMVFRRKPSLTPQVRFGTPATVAELRADAGSESVMPAIIYSAQQLLSAYNGQDFTPTVTTENVAQSTPS